MGLPARALAVAIHLAAAAGPTRACSSFVFNCGTKVGACLEGGGGEALAAGWAALKGARWCQGGAGAEDGQGGAGAGASAASCAHMPACALHQQDVPEATVSARTLDFGGDLTALGTIDWLPAGPFNGTALAKVWGRAWGGCTQGERAKGGHAKSGGGRWSGGRG